MQYKIKLRSEDIMQLLVNKLIPENCNIRINNTHLKNLVINLVENNYSEEKSDIKVVDDLIYSNESLLDN